jgi:hypothetical protein
VINLGGDEIPWDSYWIPVLIVGFTAATVAFVRHEKTFPKPVLLLDLVRSRGMVSHIGLNLFGSIAVVAVSSVSAVWLVNASDISRRSTRFLCTFKQSDWQLRRPPLDGCSIQPSLRRSALC